jgi:hypothetical protein
MLKPFKEYTKFVSQKELTIYRVFNLYLKLKKLLDNIIRNNNKKFDLSLVAAAKKGLKKFNKYYKAIKANNIY